MLHRFMIFDSAFSRFIVVGVINTIVGSALIFALYNIGGLGYWPSSAVGYVLVSIISFFLNKYFTFGVSQWSIFMVFAFVLTIAVSYLIAYGVSKPAMSYLLKDSPQNIRENIALFTGTCLFVGLNYLGQRFVVFSHKQEKESI